MMKLEFTVDSVFPPRAVFECLLLRMTSWQKPILTDAQAQTLLRTGEVDTTFMNAPAHFKATGVDGQ